MKYIKICNKFFINNNYKYKFKFLNIINFLKIYICDLFLKFNINIRLIIIFLSHVCVVIGLFKSTKYSKFNLRKKLEK